MIQDMTRGNAVGHLIRFSLPLVIGNLFQLTYNAVDSMMVGRYVGKEALAAVGTSGAVIHVVTFFIVGICLGASVLMSEFFGASDWGRLRREVSTSLAAGLIFTAVLAGAGYMAAPGVLSFMKTPNEVMPEAASYLRIIFSGLPFCFLYNLYASALRSGGDSKTPLIFLAVSSLLNIGLDFLCVGRFSMGILGAAWATVFSQMLSAVFCILYVFRKVPLFRPQKDLFLVDRTLLKRTISYSWASGMQQICLYVGKFLIQGMVNAQGVVSMAVFNAVNRVDDFVFQPQQSIAAAMTTFLAQNRGAGKKERLKDGFQKAICLEGAYCLAAGTIIFFGAKIIMGFFVNGPEEEVIRTGAGYFHLMGLMYWMPGATNSLQGYFRGMGNMKMTLLCTFVQIVFRVGAAAAFLPLLGISGAAWANFTGWVAMLFLELPFFLTHFRKETNKKG